MPNSPSESQRVAVITGSSRGLGAATARRLARDGFFVIVNYVKSRKDAEKVLGEIQGEGGKGALVQGDVSNLAGIGYFSNRSTRP
jgi:3-oxoacyl-[acyl-carrier protein] reductase